MRLNGTTRASALALTLLLGACGGGGGGDGGVNSTPTPEPSPTPTTTVNDDLIAPLVSESFANRAATAAISSSGTQTSSLLGLTVNYDAVSDSYTIQASGRSQTFRPADRSSVGNYRRTSGNITDDLTLTPNGPSSGGTYRYVGAGFWQRQTQGSGGSIDAFVYGVPTSSLVRTGTSYYRTQAYGSIVLSGQLLAFNGDGELQAKLDTGGVNAQGRLNLINPTTGSVQGGLDYNSLMTISSGENSLTGSILFNGSYNGPIHGKFFGPNAEEVGLAFSASNSGGEVAVGTLLGRVDPSLALTPLKDLTAIKAFNVYHYGQYYVPGLTIDPVAKTYSFAARSGSALANTGPSFRLNMSAFEVGPAQKSAVQSSTKFTEYNTMLDGRSVKILFYNYGSNNSEVQLSYASFYRLEGGVHFLGGPEFVRHELYGQETPTNFLPRTGSATYIGPIYGSGENGAGQHVYEMTGQSNFAVDFAAGTRLGTLNMLLTPVAGGSALNIVENVNLGSSFLTSSGYITHRFYGPNAEELGVAFGYLKEISGGYIALSGVTVGKKQ